MAIPALFHEYARRVHELPLTRRLAVAILACGALLLAVLSSDSAGAATNKTTCGEAEKFGHTFEVRIGGEEMNCRRALRLIEGPCKLRTKREWSCFSFQVKYPFIVWFPTDEMFDPAWTSFVIYKRYPCSQAVVTRELFATPPRGFPSLRQLLADDLIRCNLLEGSSIDEVRALLGPPDYGRSSRSLSYNLGLERDSFFQVDPEFLLLSFRKNGRFAGANIFQG